MTDFGMTVVEELRRSPMIDDSWTVSHDRGFTWWADDLAQHFSLGEVRSTPSGDECTLRVWTDVVTDVDPATNPERLLGLANMRELAMNALVWDRDSATIKVFCSMSIHEGNADFAARLIGLPTVLQKHMAHALADRLTFQSRGTRATSSNPRTGSHGDSDDLGAFAGMVVGAGEGPSVFSNLEPDATPGDPRGSWMSRLPAYSDQLGCPGAGNDVAFSAEVPFAGSGSPGHVDIFTHLPHPVFGNGAWVVLQLPLAPGPDEAFALANALNNQEFDWVPPGLALLGAWSPDFLVSDMNGLAFSTFVPNKLAGSGMLENLFTYAALRARFAADVLGA
ncbi:hypothetical protein AB4Z39_26075 [Mycobacterium adipatum]|uniref:hypothetical protein n=1 Tax=Mycobacterium adipatum TaxID=1682113 RepID=UPI0034E0CC98